MNNESGSIEVRKPLVRCQHILCKEMLVFGDEYLLSKPDVDESGTGFWCQLTQSCRGPDGELVAMKRCVAGRGCFAEL